MTNSSGRSLFYRNIKRVNADPGSYVETLKITAYDQRTKMYI